MGKLNWSRPKRCHFFNRESVKGGAFVFVPSAQLPKHLPKSER
jgi:hypothetical protein